MECNKTLSLNVPTMWNSAYLMLEKTQHFEKVFDRFEIFLMQILKLSYLLMFVKM